MYTERIGRDWSEGQWTISSGFDYAPATNEENGGLSGVEHRSWLGDVPRCSTPSHERWGEQWQRLRLTLSHRMKITEIEASRTLKWLGVFEETHEKGSEQCAVASTTLSQPKKKKWRIDGVPKSKKLVGKCSRNFNEREWKQCAAARLRSAIRNWENGDWAESKSKLVGSVRGLMKGSEQCAGGFDYAQPPKWEVWRLSLPAGGRNRVVGSVRELMKGVNSGAVTSTTAQPPKWKNGDWKKRSRNRSWLGVFETHEREWTVCRWLRLCSTELKSMEIELPAGGVEIVVVGSVRELMKGWNSVVLRLAQPREWRDGDEPALPGGVEIEVG